MQILVDFIVDNGSTKVAQLLTEHTGSDVSVARVQNWITRGVPGNQHINFIAISDGAITLEDLQQKSRTAA